MQLQLQLHFSGSVEHGLERGYFQCESAPSMEHLERSITLAGLVPNTRVHLVPAQQFLAKFLCHSLRLSLTVPLSL